MTAAEESSVAGSRGPLAELLLLGLKLGFTAFGGPAAHISMLRKEVVDRRRWIDDRHFLDYLGITNLIPGPNSTEMVMHVGALRGGWRGLVIAGAAFIVPAAGLTLALAWLYVRYGTTPAGYDILWGIKPVILAIVVQAIWALGRTAIKKPVDAVLVVIVAALYLAGLNELVVLFAGTFVVAGVRSLSQRIASGRSGTALALGMPWHWLGGVSVMAAAATTVPYSALRLFLTFLKIGAVLYGSGYVLVAFMRDDFVSRYGWLTEQQLLDAVAAGQLTPGPVFTTATFVGYLVGGWQGAFLATVAIFLPAFFFVALTHPLLPKLRAKPRLSRLLDAVNLVALALMAAVSWLLAGDAIVDVWTAALAMVGFAVLVRFRLNPTWLIGAGAVAGLVRLSVG